MHSDSALSDFAIHRFVVIPETIAIADKARERVCWIYFGD